MPKMPDQDPETPEKKAERAAEVIEQSQGERRGVLARWLTRVSEGTKLASDKLDTKIGKIVDEKGWSTMSKELADDFVNMMGPLGMAKMFKEVAKGETTIAKTKLSPRDKVVYILVQGTNIAAYTLGVGVGIVKPAYELATGNPAQAYDTFVNGATTGTMFYAASWLLYEYQFLPKRLKNIAKLAQANGAPLLTRLALKVREMLPKRAGETEEENDELSLDFKKI